MVRAQLFMGLLLVAFASGGGEAWATTFYTAATGNDAHTCAQAQSISSPKRTINSAVTCVRPGDTLYVRAGVYAELLAIGKVPSGTSWTSSVRIAAYPGETVRMRPTSGARVLEFGRSQQYIEFDGIDLDGYYMTSDTIKINAGMTSLGHNAHHLRFQNLTVTGLGKLADGSMVLDVDNDATAIGHNEYINLTVTRNRDTGFRANAFYINSSDNLIERCHIYGLDGAGVHVWNAAISTSTHRNVVRYNVIHDFLETSAPKGRGIMIARGTGNKVYGNLIYNIRQAGPDSGGALYVWIYPKDTEVYNNTVYNNALAGIIIDSGVTGTVVRNNISYQNGGGDFVNRGTSTTWSHNVFGQNPGFVDPSSADFRLKAGSPALNSGTVISVVTQDLLGVPRPQGGAYDVGALEFVEGTQLTAPAPPSNVRVTAN